MIQDEFFKKHKLIICNYPQKENDKPNYVNDSGKSWYINKELLYKELSKRPHRIRVKDRRKKRNK